MRVRLAVLVGALGVAGVACKRPHRHEVAARDLQKETRKTANVATAAASAAASSADKVGWDALVAAAAGNLQSSSFANWFKIGQAGQTGNAADVIEDLTNFGGPTEVDTSTLFTLGLSANPKVTKQNTMNLMSALFGYEPNLDGFKNIVGSKNFNEFASNINGLLSGKSTGGGFKKDCAWQATVTSDRLNISLPDGNSVYHVQFVQNFGPGMVMMLEGQFPDARYFSFQSYDENFQPIASLRDVDLKAYTGTNPFRNKTTDPTINGRFRVYVTKDGKKGYANELAGSQAGYSESNMVMIVYRLYGVDPLAPGLAAKGATSAQTTDISEWGYVAPPTISTKTYGSTVPTAFDSTFSPITQCPDSNTDAVNTAVKAVVETNLQNNNRTCMAENLEDGFILFTRPDSKSGRAPFINKDGAYLIACGNNRPEYIETNDLIAEVTQYFPSTPNSKYASTFVGQPSSYEVRYASLSVYDLQPPSPLIKTIGDADAKKFYYEKHGAQQWEVNMGRKVGLLVGRNTDVLKKCGFNTDDNMVVELDDAKYGVPEWWGVIYREVLSQSQVITQNNSLSFGMLPEDIYRQGVADARDQMCIDDTCDNNPYRAASIMKQRYPQVKWWVCNPNGKVTPAVATANPFDTKYATYNGIPPSTQYFYKYCDADVNQALLKAYAPTTLSTHYASQPANASMGNFVSYYPISVSTLQKNLVVGAVPRAPTVGGAYFKAELSLCGYTYITDPKWKCTHMPPADDRWLLDTFDDSHWDYAVTRNVTLAVDGIDPSALFITSKKPGKSAYCRLVLPNPTYQQA